MGNSHSRFSTFVLPSPILCDADVQTWEHIQLKFGYTLSIYSPYISADLRFGHQPEPNLIESNKRARLKSRSGEYESLSIPVVRMLPLLNNISDRMAVFTGREPSSEMLVAPVDTVSLEISGDGPPLRELLRRFLRAARRRTLQAWLGKATVALGTSIELSFELDSDRHPLSTPVQSRGYHFGFPDVMRMRQQDWKDCWLAVAEPSEDNGLDAILEAYFESIEGRVHTYFLYSALSLELMKYELWDHLFEIGACQKSQYRSATNDSNKPFRYFGPVLYDVIGESFAVERPKCYETLCKAWDLRGLVAHAKSDRIHSIIPEGDMTNFKNDLWSSLRELNGFVSRLV